jgi:hypothetical protein
MAEPVVLDGVAGEAVPTGAWASATFCSKVFSLSRGSETGEGFSSTAATTGAADRGEDPEFL